MIYLAGELINLLFEGDQVFEFAWNCVWVGCFRCTGNKNMQYKSTHMKYNTGGLRTLRTGPQFCFYFFYVFPKDVLFAGEG